MSVEINVLNDKFEAKGKHKVALDLGPETISVPAIHQVVKATLAGRRQGNASTKCKGLVSGGGKKPFKQKGTGNARRGSQRSSLMVGGGTAFGPLPRSYEQKINKGLMLKAIHSVLADKFQSGKLLVIEKFPQDGKTKTLNKLLEDRKLMGSLLVTKNQEDLVVRAAKNLPRAKALPVGGFSVYEAIKYENLIMEKDAFESLLKKLV
jgi:large subunit ribosomal protein L4